MKKVKAILFNGNCDADLRMAAGTSYCLATLRLIAQRIEGDKRGRSAGALHHSDRRGVRGRHQDRHAHSVPQSLTLKRIRMFPHSRSSQQTHILPLGFEGSSSWSAGASP